MQPEEDGTEQREAFWTGQYAIRHRSCPFHSGQVVAFFSSSLASMIDFTQLTSWAAIIVPVVASSKPGQMTDYGQ